MSNTSGAYFRSIPFIYTVPDGRVFRCDGLHANEFAPAVERLTGRKATRVYPRAEERSALEPMETVNIDGVEIVRLGLCA